MLHSLKDVSKQIQQKLHNIANVYQNSKLILILILIYCIFLLFSLFECHLQINSRGDIHASRVTVARNVFYTLNYSAVMELNTELMIHRESHRAAREARASAQAQRSIRVVKLCLV